jgi:tRNA(fMet)-specific endonuclease VapC
VRTRFQDVIARGSEVNVSAVVLLKLWYGVEKNVQQESNTGRLEAFFTVPINLLSFNEEDARVAEKIRAAVEKTGWPIGAYDLLISGGGTPQADAGNRQWERICPREGTCLARLGEILMRMFEM